MTNTNKGFGVISLILSLVGLLFGFAIPMGIAAIVLAAIEEFKTPFAIAGAIIGALDILIVLALLASY